MRNSIVLKGRYERIKIAIVNLTHGGMSGGYQKYLRNVIPRIVSHPEVKEVLCASPKSLNIQDWFDTLPKVKFVNCQPFRFLAHNRGLELRKHLEVFLPDVIFLPIERYFRFNKIPVVNMIQNMEPFVSGIKGNSVSEKFRNLARSIEAKRSIKKSNRVIAISEYVRDFLIKHLNMPNDKISLIYHGVDLHENKEFHRPDIIPKKWDGQFLFTAGSIRPARGLEDIFKAMQHIADKFWDILGLVIAGSTTPEMEKYRKQLEKWVQKNNLSAKVCWAGSLNEKEMAWCYQNCFAFVMTSRVEACPNIALEAMSHSCLIVSTTQPPMPEFFKNAAFYYNAEDSIHLAQQIHVAQKLSDAERKDRCAKSINIAKEFSWEQTARLTVDQLVLCLPK